MEALTALGLASNVIQFIDFTSGLINTTTEIAISARGASKRTLELEHVYTSLRSFSSSLQAGAAGNGGQNGPQGLRGIIAESIDMHQKVALQVHERVIQQLAMDCGALCDELLEIVQKLQTSGGSRSLFKSFLMALKTVWSSKKIEETERRLGIFQRMISLHFFPLLSHQQSYMLQAVNSLREEGLRLRLDQSTRLDEVASRLTKLTENLPQAVGEATPTIHDLSRASVLRYNQACDSMQPTQVSVNPSQLRIDLDDTLGEIKRSWQFGLADDMYAAMQSDQNGTKDKPATLDTDQLKELAESISKLSLTERDLLVVAKEQAFLRTLNFESRPSRHNDIATAHGKTFQWILDPSREERQDEESKQHSLLSKWLRHGSGMFWVSGKAGSGKSTLMKFVADHKQTRLRLEEWAGQRKLVVASHYFWAAGSALQKSQQGLLRSLLFDILGACPETVPDICPVRWSRTTIGSLRHTEVKDWTTQELLETLQAVFKHPDLPVRYCLFIDGVDEFDGDHFALCQVLKGLSLSPNVKFCLSSRPWNVFEDAFGADQNQMIYTHDLTRQDVLNYAQSRLMEHPRWNLRYFSQQDMSNIINNITERAYGVFLWVFLVTRSLRDGLVNGDTIRDLQKRLDSLPTDLEAFFKHMLGLVEPIYHKNMARILRLAMNAKSSLSLEFYAAWEYEDEDPDYALNRPIELFSYDSPTPRLEQCRRRMNARCGGLLEITSANQVVFLHRTVRDFLFTREMHDHLCEKSGYDFKVNLSTLKGFLFLLRCPQVIGCETRAVKDLFSLSWEGMEYANSAIMEDEETAMTYLDAAEDLYEGQWGMSDVDFETTTPDYRFRTDMIRQGADRYVSAKLRESPFNFEALLELPLCTAIMCYPWSQGHANTMKQFLEGGADPNQLHYESPWHMFIQQTCTLKDEEKFEVALKNSLFLDFLKHGAKRTSQIYCDADAQEARVLAASVNALGIRGPRKAEPRLPCAHFVEALFTYSCSHSLANECLDTLEEFLSGEPAVVRLQVAKLMDVVPTRLFQLPKTAVEPARRTFFARVLRKIIAKGNEHGLNMESLIPHIARVFRGSMGASLLDMIQNKKTAALMPSSLVAQKRRHDGKDESVSKVLRSVGMVDTKA